MVAYFSLGKEVWDYRYNIGYWAWELETFPEEWLPAFKLVDEVWTPSDFVTNTFEEIYRQACDNSPTLCCT